MPYYQDYQKKQQKKDRREWTEEPSSYRQGRSPQGRRTERSSAPRGGNARPFGAKAEGRFERVNGQTRRPLGPARDDRRGSERGHAPTERAPQGRYNHAYQQSEAPRRTNVNVVPRENRPAPSPAKPAFETPYAREPENLLSGRNPIREALKAGRDIEKMLVAKGDLSGSAREIVAMARERGVPVQVVERSRLDEITPHHQGILAYASAYQYAEVDDILALARERGEKPFVVVLDGITDPHNLGAIIRTASCAGAHGVIVPLRRSVGLTPAAVKASAGAVETVRVARVTNLTQTLRRLKQAGLWIYAADMSGEDYRSVRLEKPMALVIGSEGEGISRLVLENADFVVKLPLLGAVDSLNASVAAGILMYHAAFSGQ